MLSGHLSSSSSSSSSSSDSETDELILELLHLNQQFLLQAVKSRLNYSSSSSESMDQEDSSPGPGSPNSLISSPTHTTESDRAANIYTFSNENPNNSIHDHLQEATSNSTAPPPAKRPKSTHPTQTLDRISLLPDSILHLILSLLPIHNAVASGTLSKRWKHTWTSLPNLIFKCIRSWGGGLEDFVEFVDKTILLYGNRNIKEFVLEFEFSKHFVDKVTTWIRFATRRNAEKIDLNFLGDPTDFMSDGEHYTLPRFVFDNSLVKSLSLRYCEFAPGREISWNVLKNLTIGYAALSNELIEMILSGSPVLECLELYKCGGITRIDVKSASLKKLVVNGYWEAHGNSENEGLEISGNNLSSLSLMGYFDRRKLKVRNVCSLVDATLDFHLFEVLEDEDDIAGFEEANEGMMREILESIHHVQEVTIGNLCLQVLSKCEIKAAPPLLSKHKCLNLDTHLKYSDLPGIALLLRSSPDLGKLVINMARRNRPSGTEMDADLLIDESLFFNVKKDWASQEMRFSSLLLNLHTVEIVGLIADPSNDNHFILLMQFFLKNARVLKRMVIHPHQYDRNRWRMHGTTKDLLNIGQKLLSFPRSSSHAEIILHPMKD